VAAVLSTALSCSGARVPLQAAPAPAPSSASTLPSADLLFIVSANAANLTDDNSLVLSNVAETAQFTAAHGRSGVYPIAFFTSTASGSQFLSTDGQWLDNPQAVLFGANSTTGNQTAVLLTLGDPVYDASAQTVTFTYKQLPAAVTSLKYAGGAVGDVIVESQSNAGTPVASQIAPGTTLNSVALFVDMNQQAMQPKAETKTFWWPFWGGWGGYGGCGWGCGYGGGYPYGGYGWGK